MSTFKFVPPPHLEPRPYPRFRCLLKPLEMRCAIVCGGRRSDIAPFQVWVASTFPAHHGFVPCELLDVQTTYSNGVGGDEAVASRADGAVVVTTHVATCDGSLPRCHSWLIAGHSSSCPSFVMSRLLPLWNTINVPMTVGDSSTVSEG